MTRTFLILAGLATLVFGLWSVADPVGMLAGLGVTIGGPHALIEGRGVYGGVCIAGGLLALAGAVRPSLERPALWFLATYSGGYIIGRAVSLAVDGLPQPSFWGIIAFEAVLAGAALVLLARPAPAH